jgi:hypothetical protein
VPFKLFFVSFIWSEQRNVVSSAAVKLIWLWFNGMADKKRDCCCYFRFLLLFGGGFLRTFRIKSVSITSSCGFPFSFLRIMIFLIFFCDIWQLLPCG